MKGVVENNKYQFGCNFFLFFVIIGWRKTKKKREKIILLLDFDAKKVQLTTKIEKEVTRLFTTRKDITHTVAFFFLNYTNVDL